MEGRGVLIDTSSIIAHIRSKGSKPTSLAKAWDLFDDHYISSITCYEVELGARIAGRRSDLEELLSLLTVIPVGEEEAKAAAELNALLIKRNKRIDHRDALIAGTAIVHNLPLLTENKAHFERVPGLRLVRV